MASVPFIPHMKARVLTVMSTRSQDQDLVSEVALQNGLKDRDTALASSPSSQRRMVPSFGWHPWFSYQLYDDSVSNPTYDGTPSGKVAHYDEVLAPAPSTKDVSFSEGLPDPRPLSDFIKETRTRLEQHPLAIVGEIGLDKAFRLPQSWTAADEAQRDEGLTPGGREGRLLSPHRVKMAHQATVLQAQLRLAGELGRPVSVHGVQVHGVLYDTIAECWKGHEKEVLSKRQQRRIAQGAEDFSEKSKSDHDDEDPQHDHHKGNLENARSGPPKPDPKPYPPRICVHSYSGHVGMLKQYIHPSVPAKVYFSFSIAINWGAGGGEKTEEVIRAVPDDRILVESDLHTAGDRMDQLLEEICRKICQIKGWGLREGVERLGRNYREFIFG
ncbi:Uu.00g049990.m01.CDS01 [Anthostomella pinea]|uniref:Uu.00g049990.m01.CDS01 n=1 Tax=Anthostomella pinea TaxID=933095 RepID=A0AAI8VC26_9PEZI|nr:Uu.00g049990.m01.CDS01 [Anthostomella pinea]